MHLLKAISYLEDHWKNDPQVLFQTILVLNSLNSCSISKVSKMKTEISSTLLNEVGKYKTFNYWFRDSTFYSNEPYPDDLDDTFCAWTSLFFNDEKTVDGDVLLSLSKILLLSQSNFSGPYFTWVVDYKNPSNSKWKDLDFVVNLNIARFLFSQKISSPGLNNFIEKKIESKSFNSIFYKGELPSLYFLSYFYNGSSKEKIKEKIVSYLNKGVNGPSIILLLIAIIRFGFLDLLSKFDWNRFYLLQETDGSFPAFDFYKYKDKNTGKKYFSSKIISTALFIELLSLLKKIELNNKKIILNEKLSNLFDERISFLGNSLSKRMIKDEANKIINSKQSEFALFLPQNFLSSLKEDSKLKKDLTLNLSLVNLLAWISYTIYDHINDDEGDFEKLPLANLSFQILIKELVSFPKNSKYLNKIINLFVVMEKNSLKEMRYFRFKQKPWNKISKLSDFYIKKFSYEKSIGQIFSIYFLLDYLNLSDKKIILDILKNMILIKQINDDAHDSFEDLSKGHINSCNYLLLKLISSNKKRDLFLKGDMKELRLIYHKQVVPIFSKEMSLYIRKTEDLLSRQTILKKNNFIKIFLKNYKIIIEKGERERNNLINYLK